MYLQISKTVLVNAGSRYEVSYPSGVSLLLERIAFTGSSLHKSKDEVLKAIESLNGIHDCQSSRYDCLSSFIFLVKKFNYYSYWNVCVNYVRNNSLNQRSVCQNIKSFKMLKITIFNFLLKKFQTYFLKHWLKKFSCLQNLRLKN